MAKDTQTYLQSLSFEELVNEATKSIHIGLIDGGGRVMKSTIHLWLTIAIKWSEEGKGKKK